MMTEEEYRALKHWLNITEGASTSEVDAIRALIAIVARGNVSNRSFLVDVAAHELRKSQKFADG